ncbi:MAG: kynureninase [Chloracidobacterium sp.]|nr:kynureninase [Chloracidobacterium sp.]MCO5333114.1 kynureninase [Pyrinomonadaceae bacterium]
MSFDDHIELDEHDPLRAFRERFFIPKQANGDDVIYLTGNSLGLQPKRTREYIEQELDDWARLGVDGHTHARHPWLPYHEFVTEAMARVVGAKPIEVVAMNSLTVNLHLLMVSFYRPSPARRRIMIEKGAFPSDRYAVASQIAWHRSEPPALAGGQSAKPVELSANRPPANAGGSDLIELAPREGESTLRTEDIIETIECEGDSVALILLGGVNYYTGQAFDVEAITEAGHRKGCIVGFDLAHAAGNLELKLHEWGVDLAAWCSYKYLNAGPGGIAGVFVHERHAQSFDLPRFAGWWGHDKATRFLMGPKFAPIEGAEGWQLSNPPIFQLAALRASLEIFDEATMPALREKSVKLTGFLEGLLSEIETDRIEVITPSDAAQRGCQLSIRVRNADKTLFDAISKRGVIADWREPDVIRVAPVPLYNTFEDVSRFAAILKKCIGE